MVTLGQAFIQYWTWTINKDTGDANSDHALFIFPMNCTT